MEILNRENYNEFDEFCKNHHLGAFQQSPQWAKVKTQWIPEICVVRNQNNEIIGGVMLLIRKAGIKTLMYACRGPICDYTDIDTLQQLTDGIRQIAKKHKAYKVIMDPLVLKEDAQIIENFINCGFNFTANADFNSTIQPRYNYMLTYLKNLSKDELMAKMNRDTRYYIRYAIKKGIICKNLGLEGLDDFYNIYSKTGERQHFTVRPKEYFAKMLKAFPDNCRLYMCYFEDKPLCGGVAVQYAGTVSHVYGCSNDEMRNLRPTYALQWELMSWAIETGCHTYDMQGVATNPEDSEALYRILSFKSNFTGEVVETCGEFTITFDKLYAKAIDSAILLRKKLK